MLLLLSVLPNDKRPYQVYFYIFSDVTYISSTGKEIFFKMNNTVKGGHEHLHKQRLKTGEVFTVT